MTYKIFFIEDSSQETEYGHHRDTDGHGLSFAFYGETNIMRKDEVESKEQESTKCLKGVGITK